MPSAEEGGYPLAHNVPERDYLGATVAAIQIMENEAEVEIKETAVWKGGKLIENERKYFFTTNFLPPIWLNNICKQYLF